MSANAASAIECAVLSGAPSVPVIAGTALGFRPAQGEAQPLSALLRADPVLVLRLLRASEALEHPHGLSVARRIDAVIDAGGQALIRAALLDTHHWSSSVGTVPDGFRRYWSHSLLTAETARELSLRCGHSDPDEAYIAGLLLDVALPLLSVNPSYLNLLAQGHDESALAGLEAAELGVSHAEMAADLLPAGWAGELADAVRFHHADAALFHDAPELLRVARAAEELSGGGSGDAMQHAALAHALTGLPMDQLNDAWQTACRRTHSRLDALQLLDPGAPMIAGEPYRPFFEGLPDPAFNPANGNDPQQSVLLDLARSGLLAQVLEPAADNDVLRAYRLAGALLLDLPMPQMLLPAHGETRFAVLDEAGEPGGIQLDLAHSGLGDLGQQLLRGLPWYCEDARQAARLPISIQRLLRPARGEACLMLPLLGDGRVEALALHRMPVSALSGLRKRAAGLDALTGATARALRMQRVQARNLGELRSSMVEQYAAHSRQLRADLNTPLGLLKHQVKSMRLKMGADSMLESELSVFNDQVIRIDTVLHQFESRPPDITAAAQWTDINQLIEQIMAETDERTFRARSITTELHLDSALPPLHLPLPAMRDIVAALLTVSAEQIGSGGGRIAVSSADGVNWNGVLHAEIRIRDFGRGMDAARVAALFASTAGEGLARPTLAHALAQIRALGGSLSCKSAIGQGTVFQLLLPRQTRRRAPAALPA
ncbi:MAG: HDOD domain-containing protein [Pseudomonadota bacterium]